MNDPLSPPPVRQTSMIGRVILSFVFGALIATVTLFAGLQQANQGGSIRQILFRQKATIAELSQARDEIVQIQKKTHRLPSSLANLSYFSGDHTTDSWGNPIHYSVHDSHFELLSYGSDGKPGGAGLAADLTPDSKPADNSFHLTMTDFLTYPDTRNMVLAAIGTGVLSVFLCLLVTTPQKSDTSYKLPIGWRLLLVFGAAVFVGSIITALHAPTGH